MTTVSRSRTTRHRGKEERREGRGRVYHHRQTAPGSLEVVRMKQSCCIFTRASVFVYVCVGMRVCVCASAC